MLVNGDLRGADCNHNDELVDPTAAMEYLRLSFRWLPSTRIFMGVTAPLAIAVQLDVTCDDLIACRGRVLSPGQESVMCITCNLSGPKAAR